MANYITNYDRIREMSVEEMAILLGCIDINTEENVRTINGKVVFDTTRDIREWLESEVEDNDT